MWLTIAVAVVAPRRAGGPTPSLGRPTALAGLDLEVEHGHGTPQFRSQATRADASMSNRIQATSPSAVRRLRAGSVPVATGSRLVDGRDTVGMRSVTGLSAYPTLSRAMSASRIGRYKTDAITTRRAAGGEGRMACAMPTTRNSAPSRRAPKK
jgi:hypothetical protein